MSLSPGSSLAHYRLVAPLGAGGMGEVYRATDTKLGRDVALKVLPADLARDADRLARFQREARAVAALNHPHIVTIHSVEEVNGVHFFTMELVEGESLDRLIPVSGLAAERLVQIALAIADALATAHDKGIVHRDLKPANVMLAADGRVKVLDFGLAKVATGNVGPGFSPADRTADVTLLHTREGIVMGTVPYMSPEQVTGREVDHRTDIFSLGVLLHEMASGKRPFAGESSIELASAILRDTPPPVSEMRSDLPSALADVIRQCLVKDPRQRIQTARQIGDACRRLTRSHSGTAHDAVGSSVREPVTPPQDEAFRVAVLPFTYHGTNPDLAALAEGLSEAIVTGLSRFSYLRVVARTSAARDSADARRGDHTLGARYVMEGSLRHAGTKLRLAALLVDTATGTHLWAENYERTFSPDAVFELQDDLVPLMVSTVADINGVLPRSMSAAVRSRPADQLSPYQAVLRAFGYFERVTAAELAAARSGLEAAVQTAPDYADAWALLALLSAQEYGQGFNLRADCLASGAIAARRAVEAGPSNHLACISLAQVLFFQKEYQTFRHMALRAAVLNPMDGNSVAYMGELLAYSGDWDNGLALSARAKALNPHHPGWYWFPDFFHAYEQRDYRAALDFVLKTNMPGHWGANLATAAVYAQLGDGDAARKALGRLLELRPDFAVTIRPELAKWFQPAWVDHLIDGLRKAGLDVPAVPPAATPAVAPHAPPKSSSGAVRADEGFWVAVLPFKTVSADPDVATLADGLSEAIVSGLSLFSYLRVIARSSTERYAREPADVRTLGQQIGARYVMEGTLRQAGAQLRVAVQLVDAATGAHLWANTYNRSFDPKELFTLEDDLVPRIVSTVADPYGVLPHSMSQTVRSRPASELTPYEALLRSLSYAERVTAQEHAEAKAALERTLEQSPAHSDCWAMLSIMLADEYGHGFGASAETLERALKAARRAVDANPSNHRAYQALAWALFLRKEFPPCRQAGERALALNPMDACTAVYVGQTVAYSGDWPRGCALIARAIDLNPHHPGWYWYASFLDAYRRLDYAGALTIALKMNLPGVSLVDVALAATYGQLGERDAARGALRELLDRKPDYAGVARDELRKWFDEEIVEHLIDGLCKAGLEIDEAPTATRSAREAGSPT